MQAKGSRDLSELQAWKAWLGVRIWWPLSGLVATQRIGQAICVEYNKRSSQK